jgi:hypothetical protein
MWDSEIYFKTKDTIGYMIVFLDKTEAVTAVNEWL